ncbi:MAG: di-trans,poly-cis-decaprenylcistransferase [Syntrophobacterales bacterium]|nr:MAG: di-trans,poly-cis-decaprenylcistransferase [Syntrophobacterales bacterium]
MNAIKNLIYRFYGNKLLSEVKRTSPPRHVGLILDGNRRYAIERGLKPITEGHRIGADKLDEVLSWCDELKIRNITIWVFSMENLFRSQEEVKEILEVIEWKIQQLAQNPLTHKRRMKIKAIGKMELLPETTLRVIKEAEEATRTYDNFSLNIALGYGGRQEIADALKDLVRNKLSNGVSLEDIIGHVTPDEIGRHLYTLDLPDPDLIIRTSGEIRMSGFLLWQSAYSEFYFCDVYWPAFRKIDFLRAIRSYQQRERRFGR